jgi:CII-binding regulator of phage lambda lysogenization HflD
MHPHSITVAGSTILAGNVASAKHIQQLAEEGEIESLERHFTSWTLTTMRSASNIATEYIFNSET